MFTCLDIMQNDLRYDFARDSREEKKVIVAFVGNDEQVLHTCKNYHTTRMQNNSNYGSQFMLLSALTCHMFWLVSLLHLVQSLSFL